GVLDKYLGLRIPSLSVVDDDTCVPVVEFLSGPQSPRRGIWIFFAARPDEEALGKRVLSGIPGTTLSEPVPRYLVVTSDSPAAPRRLVETGLALRRRWLGAIPGNPRATDNVQADRQALSAPAACKGHGFLDDP